DQREGVRAREVRPGGAGHLADRLQRALLHGARLTARAEFALAGVLVRLDRTAEADVLYRAALEGTRGRGGSRDEARVLDALAELAEREGRDDEARGLRLAAAAARGRSGLA
ncbi:hypothetical protein ABZ896_52600, partial [Streptomyces sp. NPDC047072]